MKWFLLAFTVMSNQQTVFETATPYKTYEECEEWRQGKFEDGEAEGKAFTCSMRVRGEYDLGTDERWQIMYSNSQGREVKSSGWVPFDLEEDCVEALKERHKFYEIDAQRQGKDPKNNHCEPIIREETHGSDR